MTPDDAFRWSRENVHLWTVDLAIDDDRQSRLASLLTPDETATAARFHFEPQRRRYVAARGSLRTILAVYLQSPPASIRFEYGATGKPTLASPAAELHFNVAHSRDLAVIAVAPRRVGVDVEFVEAKPTLPRLVERLFAANDAQRWANLPPAQQAAAFYRSWTWKEAFLKATGRGFASSLDGFSLQLTGDDALEVPIGWRGEEECGPWRCAHFAPCEGFMGAVAIEDEKLQFRIQRWDGDYECNKTRG